MNPTKIITEHLDMLRLVLDWLDLGEIDTARRTAADALEADQGMHHLLRATLMQITMDIDSGQIERTKKKLRNTIDSAAMLMMITEMMENNFTTVH